MGDKNRVCPPLNPPGTFGTVDEDDVVPFLLPQVPVRTSGARSEALEPEIPLRCRGADRECRPILRTNTKD